MQLKYQYIIVINIIVPYGLFTQRVEGSINYLSKCDDFICGLKRKPSVIWQKKRMGGQIYLDSKSRAKAKNAHHATRREINRAIFLGPNERVYTHTGVVSERETDTKRATKGN